MVCLLLAASVLVACNDDGRTLAPPPDDATPTLEPSATSGANDASSAPSGMRISSPDFADGGVIPTQFTCDGGDAIPRLELTNPPASATELAVTVEDPDAGGFVHWVIAGIDPIVRTLDANSIPTTAVELTNDFGRAGWNGPCPPPGTTHRYTFTVYAFAEPVGLSAQTPARDAIVTLAETQVGYAAFSGTYTRPG